MVLRQAKHEFSFRIVISAIMSFFSIIFFGTIYMFFLPLLDFIGIANFEYEFTTNFSTMKWTIFGLFYVTFILYNMYFYFISEKTIEEEEREDNESKLSEEERKQQEIEKLLEDI